MAEPSAETKPGTGDHAWERNSTRTAILDAARRVAEREGPEAVTLGRVAGEAGFAPTAVYAYFVSKNDLHLAMVANDLAALARTMRGDAPFLDEVKESESEPAGESEPAQSDEAPEEETADGAIPEDLEALAPLSQELVLSNGDSNSDPNAADDIDFDASEVGDVDFAPDTSQEVSLAEIEQAIGVVLASDGLGLYEEDYSGDTRDVPDAFPEEAVSGDAASAEGDAPEQESADEPVLPFEPVVQEERRSKPEAAGLLKRFRSSRKDKSDDEPAPPSADVSPQPGGVADAGQMAAAIAQLEQTVARLEARPVDAWLERRLRVFERTLADIESRMERTERDSSTAMSTVSEGFKALEERLAQTVKGTDNRGDESEHRHRAVVADLRMYVKDLSGRLSVLETSVSRALSESLEAVAPHRMTREAMLAEDAAAHAEPEVVPADSGADADAGSVRPSHDETYLSVARRAANSAAAHAELSGPRNPLDYLKVPAGIENLPLSRRTLQLVASVLALVLVMVLANVVLKGYTKASAVPAAAPLVSVQSTAQRIANMAKAGNPKAALIVALKFLNGDDVATDVPSAAYWLRKAAVKQEPVAAYWLGTLYERGRGVPKSAGKAVQWYDAAAKEGNAKAMYRAGVASAEGWNGEPDYAQAAQWFTKAANFGVIDAQYNLAVLYERGEGVPQNLTEAFKWYAIAAAQGDAESKSRLDALATQITSDNVRVAQKAAGSFAPTAPDPAANATPDELAVARAQ